MLDNSLFLYLVESSVCMIMLYWVYKYILFRDTHFEWNRYYLIISLIVSLVYPLYHLPVSLITRSIGEVGEDALVMINPFSKQTILHIKDLQYYGTETGRQLKYLTIDNIFLIVWLSGVFRYTIELFTKLKRIKKIKQGGQKYKDGIYTIIKCNAEFPAFSFMRYIYVNQRYTDLSEKEKNKVLTHEKVHAKQLHSIDILFFEIVKIAFWFNPFVYKIIKTLKEVHEYIADAEATDKKIDKDYSNLILRLSVKRINSLLSNFSKNQLKARILMMMHPETDRLRKLRFMITMPLILLLLLIFGFAKDIVHDINSFENKKALFSYPVKGKFKIIQPFYENKKIEDVYKHKELKEKYKSYRVSHLELSILAGSNKEVTATTNGIVAKTEKYDNWGIDEYTIEIEHDNKLYSIYKHLYLINVSEGDTVLRGQTIAITGDIKLYPSISYKLLENDKAVDPMKFFK